MSAQSDRVLSVCALSGGKLNSCCLDEQKGLFCNLPVSLTLSLPWPSLSLLYQCGVPWLYLILAAAVTVLSLKKILPEHATSPLERVHYPTNITLYFVLCIPIQSTINQYCCAFLHPTGTLKLSLRHLSFRLNVF